MPPMVHIVRSARRRPSPRARCGDEKNEINKRKVYRNDRLADSRDAGLLTPFAFANKEQEREGWEEFVKYTGTNGNKGPNDGNL